MAEQLAGQAAGRRFAGRVALVTGAAGGIGAAVARRLAGEGASVVLTDRDAPRLEEARAELAAELAGAAGTVAAEVVDLGDAEQRARLVPAVVERWGRIDVLVNNAAYHGLRAAFTDLPEQEWERVLTTNVTAAATLGRAAAADMVTRGEGAIVNVASIQATLPVPTYSAYVSSKGAVLALTRALAVELSPAGVRVNAVSPGVIATDAFRDIFAGGHGATEQAEPLDQGGPTAALLGRYGQPAEVASAVTFLASAESSFVTGTTLYVDGGRSLSRLPDPVDAELRGYPIQGEQ